MAIITNTKKKMIDDLITLGTLKGMVLTSTHVTDISTQNFIDSVSANELSSTGYTVGGVTLTTVTTTISTDKVIFDCDDIALTGITGSPQFLAIYVDTGTPSTSPILRIIDFGTKTMDADNLDIVINASGILDL